MSGRPFLLPRRGRFWLIFFVLLPRRFGLRAGYVFREPKDGGPVRMTYVVNVNPNGWIPTRLVNFVCNSQAMNVSRVKNKLAETVKVRVSEGGGRGE